MLLMLLKMLKMLKMLLSLALILVTLPGVCPQRAREVHTVDGELVGLHCPRCRGSNADESKLVWTGHTARGSHVISDLSPAELLQRNMLLNGRSLVILRASVNHQGNYSCLLRNTSSQSWFKLTVHTVKSKEYEKWNTYPKTCDSQQSCRLHCPAVNVPPTITRRGLTWLKEGERADGYFPSVEEKDSGDYTCTWSFLYLNQTYNVTFTVGLKVTPKKIEKLAKIVSPVFNPNVTLGEQTVIECKAELHSELDRVCWYSGESIVEKDTSKRVFYNITNREKHGDEIKVTASLVFKKVLEEDLRENYTCQLVSVSQPTTSVSVTLQAPERTAVHRVKIRSAEIRSAKNSFYFTFVLADRAVFNQL